MGDISINGLPDHKQWEKVYGEYVCSNRDKEERRIKEEKGKRTISAYGSFARGHRGKGSRCQKTE